MAIQLFVDTNIYLSFYHYSSDDTDSLRKLKEKVIAKEVVLHLPQHVINEWERNRENKLKIAASEFSKTALQPQIPRHMMNLAMAEQYTKAIDEAKKARERLIAEATAKALTYDLEVDIELVSLFGEATIHLEDDVIYARGKMRAEKGNPPGKAGSVGDQYNWETLLSKVDNDDLFIISKDGDYSSPLQAPESTGRPYPNSFLQNEWRDRKKSSLQIFDSIKVFLTHHAKIVKDAQQALNAAAAPLAPQPAAGEFLGVEAVQPDVVQPVIENPVVAVPVRQANEAPLQNVPATAADVQAALSVPHPADAPLTDQERAAKLAAVDALVDSEYFQATHKAIASLLPFEEFFTKEDADRLAMAAVHNDQVGWIISDSDVNQFYLRLLSRHISELEPDNADGLIGLMNINTDSSFDEN